MKRSKLEVQLAFAMRAIGLPDWVEEHHFDWCCEHIKSEHGVTREPAWLVGQPYCLQCKAPAYAHEYVKGRKWAFDFAWPERKIALEVEGGVYSQGRHVRGRGYEKDAEKYREAARQGWDVIRVTGRQVTSGEALAIIERALKEPVL